MLGVLAGGAGGVMLGGPIGAAAGASLGYFTPEIGAGAKRVLGNPIGGAIAGGAIGGIAGFALGGPIGALAGGMLGGTVGGSIGTMIHIHNMQQSQQKAMNQMYRNYGYYGAYGQGMGMGYPGPMGGNSASYGYGLPTMFGPGYGQAYGAWSQNAGNAAGTYGYYGYPQYYDPKHEFHQKRYENWLKEQGYTQGSYQQAIQQYYYNSYSGVTKKLDDGSIEYLTRGGYKVNVKNHDINITDPDGKSTKIWGDTHVTEPDGTRWDGSSKASTFLLADGTKITLNADAPNGSVQNTSIYDGGNVVKIDNNKMTYESQYNPQRAIVEDYKEADGKTYLANVKGEDWREIYNQEKAGEAARWTDPAKGDPKKRSIFESRKFLPYAALTAICPPVGLALLLHESLK
ncbi:MAG: hypothetical protein J7M18_05345 [Candidatus Eremiobacteraeota bacterium]|nr:hypothetical protein [Candidatus Eremiobacteraeota bacterium]